MKHGTAVLSPRAAFERLRAGETPEQIFGTPGAVRAKLASGGGEISAGADQRTFDFVISSSAVDRFGDTIKASGWKLDNYIRSPVVLWAHSDQIPAIGRASNTRIVDGVLRSTVTFAEPGSHELADTVCGLVRQRIIKGSSVGFIPLKFKSNAQTGGFDFLEQELLEWSIVNIPANADALARARGFGIDVRPLGAWAERALDTGAPLIVPRERMEMLAREAKGPTPRFATETEDERRRYAASLKTSTRGMAEVSQLAWLVDSLRGLLAAVEFEDQLEGDASDIAERLTQALNQLGLILVDMTAEEVAELIDERPADQQIPEDALSRGQRVLVKLCRRPDA